MTDSFPVIPTLFGFEWGPAEVVRYTAVNGSVCIAVKSDHRRLTVYVSPAGRSVRAFLDGKELKPDD